MSKPIRRKIRNVIPFGDSKTSEEIYEDVKEYYKFYPPEKREISGTLRSMPEFEYDSDTKTWTRITMPDDETPTSMKILMDTNVGQIVTVKKLAEKYGVVNGTISRVLRESGYFKHIGYDKNVKIYKRI